MGGALFFNALHGCDAWGNTCTASVSSPAGGFCVEYDLYHVDNQCCTLLKSANWSDPHTRDEVCSTCKGQGGRLGGWVVSLFCEPQAVSALPSAIFPGMESVWNNRGQQDSLTLGASDTCKATRADCTTELGAVARMAVGGNAKIVFSSDASSCCTAMNNYAFHVLSQDYLNDMCSKCKDTQNPVLKGLYEHQKSYCSDSVTSEIAV